MGDILNDEDRSIQDQLDLAMEIADKAAGQ